MKEHLLEYFHAIPPSEKVLIKGYYMDQPCDITCRQFRKKVLIISDFLKKQGVSSGDRVAVVAEKCPEVIAVFFAVWMRGAILVPVCETLKPTEFSFIINDSGAKILLYAPELREHVAESIGFDNIPCYDFISWDETDNVRQRNLPALYPYNTAVIMYTSGSTGNPKGVMLTHRNIAFNAQSGAEYIRMQSDDSIMSVLPYWHSFALTSEIFTMLGVGGCICIPRNRTTLLKDMILFKPTIVLAVPRVAEVIRRGIESSVKKRNALARRFFAEAQKIALRYHTTPEESRTAFLKAQFNVACRSVLNKVRRNFGGELRYFIGGGAPLDEKIAEFFLSVNIPVYQGYGLTEAAPIISINAPHAFRVGSSGKLISWLFKENGGDFLFEDKKGFKGKHLKGELLVKGACVMRGYWNMKEETAKVLRDGWLYTGDMGYLDNDGFLILYGRKKSLICLKGGEKFYPEVVEETIKNSPYITQAMIVGEGDKTPSVLVNIDRDMVMGMGAQEIDDIIKREISVFTEGFEEYKRPSRHKVVEDFTVENGLLTSTLKIKRNEVLRKYAEEVETIAIK